MGYESVRQFVEDLAGSELHVKQVDSLAHAVLGAIHSKVASITSIGRAAARAREVSDKHSIKQVDRLLGNGKVVPFDVMKQVIPHLISGRSEIVVALDWTEFASNGHSTIALSMVTEHGRATPLLWLTVESKRLKSRRSSYERKVLEQLRRAVPQQIRVTVLADRGFADTKFFESLTSTMGFDYVIRFKAGTVVESAAGTVKTAAGWVLPNGQPTRLTEPLLTRKRRQVPAIVCVKRAGMKDSWCLVTSRRDSATDIVRLYARRFDIEHSFRDQKDWRFGLALDHMTLGTPGRRDRMLLVLALATMFAVLTGAAGEQLGLDRLLRPNTITRRTHSLLRQGREYMAGVAGNFAADIKRTVHMLWDALRSTTETYAIL
jgi:hypothetical protein